MSKVVSPNGSQFKNPDISGAPYTFRIKYWYTQTQCENGARDVRVLLLTPVSLVRFELGLGSIWVWARVIFIIGH